MKTSLFALTMLLSLITHNTLASTHIPAQYPLKKITITVIHPVKRNTPESYTISIKANGNSFLARANQEKQALTVSNDALLDLVNDFYTIHFFELADNYAVKKQVLLKEGNMVTTVISKQANADGDKLCIQLRTFKKCVTIVEGHPIGAAQIVKKIEDSFMPKQ